MKIFDAGNIFPGFTFDPATAISAAVSVGGSLLSKNASKKAASAQSSSDQAAIDEQRREFDAIQKLESPFVGAGTNSVNQLQWLLGLGPQSQPSSTSSANLDAFKNSLMPYVSNAKASQIGGAIYINPATGEVDGAPHEGWTQIQGLTKGTSDTYNPSTFDTQAQAAYNALHPDEAANQAASTYAGGSYGSLAKPFTAADFQVDPGYQFALDQGTKALQRTQAANGQLQSGAAAKAINDYTQGVANQQYGAAYDRYNTNQTNLYNKLMGLTNVGQSAASNQASAGQNMANNVSDLLTNQGNSAAAGQLGQGSAWSTGLSGLGSALSQQLTPSSGLGSSFTDAGWANFLASN